MSDDVSEIKQGAQLTALVLRDIAAHLELGHVMTNIGDWTDPQPIGGLIGRRRRRLFRAGYNRGAWDAARALRWVADRNDPTEVPDA